MVDPLAEMVSLLKPTGTLSKVVTGAGRWRLRRTDDRQPFYCVVLHGGCSLASAGHPPIDLVAGDFLLIPAAHDYVVTSAEPPPPGRYAEPVTLAAGEVRLGDREGGADVVILIGHCAFGSPDAELLVSLLPDLVHVRGEARLATLVGLIGQEARGARPARDLILARLLEVLMMEALRSASPAGASPGLLRGLADPRLAAAIRRMHGQPDRAWTVAELAGEAALSRSAFFDRFRRAVGTAPINYLLAWRMALARDLLRAGGVTVGEVARRVGYASASTFSVAFARHVGLPPARYAQAQPAAGGEEADAIVPAMGRAGQPRATGGSRRSPPPLSFRTRPC